MPGLAGTTALVTGASSGIGAATATALAKEGVGVALLARRKERLEALAGEIHRGGGDALVCPGDVTDPVAIQAAVEEMLGRWGRIDLLVNNAGQVLAAPLEATTAEELRRLLEVNLVSVLTATRAVLPAMRRQGSGHIVNVSSVVGRRGIPLRSAYSATKFAMVGLTECLRQELRGTGIHVTLVYPIYTTETELHEVQVQKVRTVPRGPVQSAKQVANAIVRCVRRPRPEVYPYPPARILAVLSAFAPGFVDWMLARFQPD